MRTQPSPSRHRFRFLVFVRHSSTGNADSHQTEPIPKIPPLTRSPFPCFPPFYPFPPITSQLLTSLYKPLTHRRPGKSMLSTAIESSCRGFGNEIEEKRFIGRLQPVPADVNAGPGSRLAGRRAHLCQFQPAAGL